jgi:hypothetical protein
MQSGKRFFSRFALPIAAAGVFSVCSLQPALAAESDQALDAAEAQALATWTSDIASIEVPGQGCFQAEYPNLYWKAVACGVGQPRAHTVPPPKGGTNVTGNGHDYAAGVSGLISKAVGTFPSVTGVTHEQSVGVAAFGDNGILGPNEYTLQLNTNFFNTTTAACQGHSGCLVWQQFIYSTDYLEAGEAEVFMQYWLINWGSDPCPSGFGSDDEGDCYGNSNYANVPDYKIARLGGETLTAQVNGSTDTVTFTVPGFSYAVSGPDSMLDISTVWNLAEFNVVGDAGGSRADFNKGSSVSVNIVVDHTGTPAKPKCERNAGTTGETNNLDLGTCTAARTGNGAGSIAFTESN